MDTSHEVNREKTTTTWLTPPDIIKSLGEFDLDPCTPEFMPWQTAAHRYTEAEDGLKQKWFGRVWLNPPYGEGMGEWLKKMAAHGNGIALLFKRSETENFQNYIFPVADAILFKRGRIHFLNNDGVKVGNGSGTGSVFVAYGKNNVQALIESKIIGKLIILK